MEILGSGIDATEIARIGEAIERYGERFVLRVFTEGEIAYCRRRRDANSSFAARFAAKEAAMKALARSVLARHRGSQAQRSAAAAIPWRRCSALRLNGRDRIGADADALP
jgi:phosphopantetheine--protein transferase-like protein